MAKRIDIGDIKIRDVEIIAIAAAVELMEEMDAAAAERVAWYLYTRYGGDV